MWEGCVGVVPRTSKLGDCPEVQSRLCGKGMHGPLEAELLGCRAWLHWLPAV